MTSAPKKKTPASEARRVSRASKSAGLRTARLDPVLSKPVSTTTVRTETAPGSDRSVRRQDEEEPFERAGGLDKEKEDREKEKVSLTLDKGLVREIRAQFGSRGLSTSINELLHAALAQERLGELVDEMSQEAGAPSPEAYDRVLGQWFAEE
jgi:uncharacterized protein (DUF4415 family)